MPFAPQIRKYILQALDERILPALTKQAVPQILAGPPWDFSPVESWTLRDKYLPHKNRQPSQLTWAWKKERLAATRQPFFGLVFDGVVDERIGITTKMAKEARTGFVLRGITAVRLHAPAVIFFPAGVPHRDGSEPFCDKDHSGFSCSRALWIRVTADAILVSYSESDMDSLFSSHSLQIKDVTLAQLAHAYGEELSYVRHEGSEGAQGLLLLIMKRLRRYLFDHPAPFANTARTTSLLPHVRSVSDENAREALCRRVIEYIEIHLSDTITCKKLADEMGVSPFYLSHAFHKITGITVMRYVQKKRIEAAKLMLSDNNERISDIAALAGYANIASFSGSFKKHAGCSPNEFRRRFARRSPSKTKAYSRRTNLD